MHFAYGLRFTVPKHEKERLKNPIVNRILSYIYIRAVGGQSTWHQCRNIANAHPTEFSGFQLQDFMS